MDNTHILLLACVVQCQTHGKRDIEKLVARWQDMRPKQENSPKPEETRNPENVDCRRQCQRQNFNRTIFYAMDTQIKHR